MTLPNSSQAKRSEEGGEEYLKPLSNHHMDSDPTAHDMVRTEWKGKKRILCADVKALSIEAF